MKLMRAVALLLLCQAAPSWAADHSPPVKDITFNGGPLDGVVLGNLIQSNGKPGFGLKPSAPNASPLPIEAATVVEGFLKAYDRKKSRLYRAFLSDDAKGKLCDGPLETNCYDEEPFTDLPFVEHCKANTPFYVGAGGDYNVRLEWIYKGQLYYISFVTLRGRKISKIVTVRATPSVLMRASPSHG